MRRGACVRGAIGAVESTTKAQISAFGALRSALAGLESALKKFDGAGADLGRKVTVGADAGFTATAATNAALGSYQISVERLATAHKLQSAPVAADTQLGHGSLSITIGSGTPLSITVAEGKGTLGDIRDAINAKAAGNGVTATVVRGDAGDVLMLSSTSPGSAGAITVAASGGDGGLAALATAGGTMTEAAAATDARIVIDGIARTATGNRISDAITGITLDLTKARPGEAFALEIANDASPLKASVLSLVSAYNTALSALRTQGAAGGEGKTAGPLSGDAAPRSITQALRGMVSSSYSELAALGLKTAVDGSLSMDGAKFDTAVAANGDAVKKLFGEAAAFGTSMRASLAAYTKSGGMLAGRTETLNSRIKQLGRQREAFEVRIGGVEAAYRRQFTALDAMMAKMQSTSSFLSQQLAQISNQK
ncbi:MAG TPA: flagellar filament capping protein FliD [Lysobacter sp.]